MRFHPILLLSASLGALPLEAQDHPAPLGRPARVIDGIPAPESVALGPDRAWYVSSFGEFDVKGDGAVYRVDPEKGTREKYATGLDDPCGLLFLGDTLWVADRGGVYRIQRGRAELVYAAKDFPRTLHFLNDLAAGPQGTMYVSDTGDSTDTGHGAVFLLGRGKRPTVVPGSDTVAAQSSVNGLLPGKGDSLYAVGFRTGVLSVTDGRGSWKDLARNLGAADGVDLVPGGALYVSDNGGGNLYLIPRTGRSRPVKVASGLEAPADLVVDRERGVLVVPENSANRLSVFRLNQSR
jgi:sugar lactone lactonase YvrE